MGIEHFWLFVAAGLLLNLTPGPDVLYIVTQGLRGGARAGLVAALGITAGCFVHIAAASIGVSALVAASATAFTLLKWLGAAYLVWMGVRMLRASESLTAQLQGDSGGAASLSGGQSAGLMRVLARGFWTNALNPKVALFFLAFLPQFIAPEAPHKTLAFLALGLVFNFNGLWVNLGYALAAAWLARRLTALGRAMRWLERAGGVLFIGFGLRLAMSDNAAR